MAWKAKTFDQQLAEGLSAVEAHLEHAATKASVLSGVLGGMAVAAGIALAVVKLFM